MRFHVNYKDTNLFIGFNARNSRFVFYTHNRQLNSVKDWKNLIDQNGLKIYDEDNNVLSWDEFIRFVDHLQYHSNARWANGFKLGSDGYNFSNNKQTLKI